MNEQLYIKTDAGYIPANDEAREAFGRIGIGDEVRAEFRRMRNVQFFRKWWALVKFAYDHWEPGELKGKQYEGVTPEKNMDRFRKDLIILAGYFDQHIRTDGSLVIEAQSLKWSKMDEETFSRLYEATVNVVLKRILNNYTRADLDEVLMHVASF